MMSAQTVITRKKPALFTAVAMGALLAISGCASNQGARDYKSSEVGQVTRIDEGTIVSAEPIMIEGREGYLGAATGAVIGGIAGSQIGGGDDEKAIESARVQKEHLEMDVQKMADEIKHARTMLKSATKKHHTSEQKRLDASHTHSLDVCVYTYIYIYI